MYRPITLSLILSLAACTGDEENPRSASTEPTTVFEENRPVVDTDWPEIGDTDGDADTDTDTDSDTDTDTDTDTDVDTDPVDTDTGTPDTDVTDTDTAVDPDPSCAVEYQAEMRDKSGNVCGTGTTAACDATADLVAVGRVHNPCAAVRVVVTTMSCLVSGWSVEDLSGGTATGTGAVCTALPATFTIAAGDHVEETADWSPLAAGEYELTAAFYDAASTSATVLFDTK